MRLYDMLAGEDPWDADPHMDETKTRALDRACLLGEVPRQPMWPHRITEYCPVLQSDISGGYQGGEEEPRQVVPAINANLVSSLCDDGMHAPAIDIDLPCQLRPSRTKGHYHLFIDKKMSWWRYRLLLWAMVVAGVVEKGYYKASVRRRATHLRWNIAEDYYYANRAMTDIQIGDLLQVRQELAD